MTEAKQKGFKVECNFKKPLKLSKIRNQIAKINERNTYFKK